MTSLTIQDKLIPEEGLSQNWEIGQQDLGILESEVCLLGPVHIQAFFVHESKGIHVSGEAKGTFSLECIRCLEGCQDTFSIEFLGKFVGESEGRSSNTSQEPECEDDDPFPIIDHQLDVRDLVREHVIIAIPDHPLCQHNCWGLCSVCGKNLNQGSCSCDKDQPLSPFKDLQKLLNRSNNPN